jgi:Holliday junction resolvase
MSNKIPLAPKSATQKKNEALEKAEMARATALFAAKKEQYTMNILNGMLANPNVRLYDIDKEVKELIDKAFDLADYQMQKMYKQVGE